MRPPCVWKLEGKTGNHQRREAENYTPMRNAEVAIHANYFCAAFVPRPFTNELREKIDQIVQDHESQGHRDQSPIGPPDPLYDRMGGASRSLHVHWPDGELALVHSFMTLPASLSQVGVIDGRARVARR